MQCGALRSTSNGSDRRLAVAAQALFLWNLPGVFCSSRLLGFLVMGYHPGLEDDGIYLTAVKGGPESRSLPSQRKFLPAATGSHVFDGWMAAFCPLDRNAGGLGGVALATRCRCS